MKKALSLIICMILIIFSFPVYSENDVSSEISVYVDGKKIEFDVPPQIIDGRTMVPMRAVFEKFGAYIEWNDEEKQILAEVPGVILFMKIGNTKIMRNFCEYTIDVPAQIIDGRTLIPIRAVSEILGADVEWDDSTKTVNIWKTDRIKRLDWNDSYYYFGEVFEENANGYGVLYNISDGITKAAGIFDNSEIIEGCSYFDNGFFYGTFSDGNISEGIYVYDDGAEYTGSFKNGMKNDEEGILKFPDGSVFIGNWIDGEMGYGNYFDGEGTYRLSGDFSGDTLNGVYTFYYFEDGTSETVEFKDGKVYDDAAKYEEEYAALEAEYIALNDWYNEELNTLYNMLENPYDTDWAQSIYESYDYLGQLGIKDAVANGGSVNGGNIDSYAASQAARYQEDFKAKADEQIRATAQLKYENGLETLKTMYERALADINNRIKALNKKYNVK